MGSLFHNRRSSSLGRQPKESCSLSSDSNSCGLSRVKCPLACPFGDISPTLSSSDIKDTAYEIFLSASRTTAAKPLTFVKPEEGGVVSKSVSGVAASKMKKALGLKGSGEKSKVVTVGEMMRLQMAVSERVDSRLRRAFFRISAAHVGRRVESMVLPLELLQQFKLSDFTDHEEYEAWQKRSLKILQAGLLSHPYVPLDKSNAASQRLRQIINGALDKPIDTGRNSETMQLLRNNVTSLASRSSEGSFVESCHWADSPPLNLRLYEVLLEALFDLNDETSLVEEIDELMELIKKTWVILGINQMLHNICFTWVLFNRYVATGQVENDLLYAADGQLEEVAKDRWELLRISAGQVGRRVESMVLPLELLQQFKLSDFTDHEEYEAWQKRSLKILQAGLLSHPYVPLDKSNAASQRLRQIINGALDKPIDTGRNSETMQLLRNNVTSLASRSSEGSFVESCHWADSPPLNLRLYEVLLEALFDLNDETSLVEEIDELMELIKKTWVILGINQMLHNICFTWVLFNRYVATGQVENDLLYAADGQLEEVAKDAKTTKDPAYSQILSSTLSSILGWAEKRLLAYHDTFDRANIQSMQGIVSLGVSAAKILVEDISNEYRRKRKGEVDVARNRIDTYIRSSIRTAFAQIMEKADSSRRASRNQLNPLPRLAILAKDVGDLAANEKAVFSPILERWHPLAAGVAVATLHACYGNELKQFVASIGELTPDAIQILRAADKLEKDLVQIAVEDSVDSDDGGKGIIREMPPFEAETEIANLVKGWIKARGDIFKDWVDRSLQQEVWSPLANQEYAPSAVEVLRIIDEALEAYFLLPIPMHPALLPDLMTAIDRCLQYYVTKARSGCGTRNTFIPTMPALTRCPTGTKIWKKKDKTLPSQKRNSQVATMNGNNSHGVPQLCVRINTLHQIRSELEVVEKRIITHLRNSESAKVEDFSNGLGKKFELTPAACLEGVQLLSEAMGYKIIFHDLSPFLWDGLYIGDPSSSRIESFLQELEKTLTVISDTVHERVRTRIIADIMKASFDGFLLVLLAGGPSRAFTKQDSAIIKDDFKSLKDLFHANGDGLPADLINKFSITVSDVLPLFQADSESLVERFRRLTLEAYGSSAKSRLPLPPTSGQWDQTEPNTILRVLCYRNDDTASKFLKKTYGLPKKL